MHVCLVSQWYPKGGVGVYTYYMALGLARSGHQVSVITSRLGDNEEREQAARYGLHIHKVSLPGFLSLADQVPGLRRIFPGIRDVLYALTVRQTLSEVHRLTPVDIVEYADVRAEGLWHVSDALPNVVKLHTPQFVLDSYYLGQEIPYNTRLNRCIEKHAILSAPALTAPSEAMAELVRVEYQLSKGHQIAIVRNPIDIDRFTNVNREKSTEPIVLLVGRLEARKGAFLFAEAIPSIASAFPQARFVFAGKDRRTAEGGSGRAVIERIAGEAGVRAQVCFQDDAPSKVFRRMYEEASICVVPSLYENYPYVLLEAMASGVPVVASAAGGIPEIVTHEETGLLFPVGHAESLAEQVIRLLERPRWARQLGQAGRNFVIRECSLDTVAAKTSDIYRRTIEKHRTGLTKEDVRTKDRSPCGY